MTLRKIRSLLAEFFFIFVCLFGCGYSIFQFWQSLNKSLTKNEEPIAIITFKYKTAQRKFIDDILWDRLRQESPIYEGDTIRTAPLSEATIYFNDGNIMSLYENTLARVSLKEDGAEIDFDGGQIEIQTMGSSGMKVKSGDSVVNIDKGASITAASAPTTKTIDPETGNIIETKSEGSSKKAENVLNIQVQSGSAELTNTTTGEVALNLQAGQTAQMDKSGNIQKKHLSIQSPLKDTKCLSFVEDVYPIDFAWDCDEEIGTKLEIFNKKAMLEPIASYDLNNLKSSKINFPIGISWWRLTSGNEYAEGKVNVYYTKIPQAVAPAANYTAVYRTKNPKIRFIWSESKRATSYELQIADNPEMNNPVIVQRTPQPSSIITTLAKGKWYWKVTPYYTINNIGLADSSEVSSFEIVQSGELSKPVLLLPEESGVVSTKIPVSETETTYKSINFSWKDNPEAVSYDFKLWAENSKSTPLVESTVTDNYLTIDTSKTFVNNGLWFWQITTNDVEGNTSVSDIRKFYAIDSNVEQRTLFPPDNYKLAETRAQDTRYNWKTNIPFDTTFQLATDITFTNIVHSETTSNTSVVGRALKPGKYYWRITTDVSGINLSTPPKTLYVAPPMSAPECISPADGSREVVREGIPVKFKWNTVEGADYYQFKLFEKEDPTKVIYEKNFIEPTKDGIVLDELQMFNMNETDYTWTLQAFSEETLTSSRAISYIGSYNFRMKKLKPARLLEPRNGTVFGGIAAVKTPSSFKWSSTDTPESAQLIIYRGDGKETYTLQVIEKPKYNQKMPQLYEGQYYWKIVAKTYDGLDISSKEINDFSVAEMPKLPAPKMLHPIDNSKIDIDYIINNGLKVNFEWESLNEQELARYILRIYNVTDPSPVFEIALDPATTSYLFEGDDFSNTLGKANGDWYWTVEGQTDFYGLLLQTGLTNQANFNVNIPRNKPGDVQTNKENGIRYGVDKEIEQTDNVKKKLKNAKKSTEKTQKVSKKKKKKK